MAGASPTPEAGAGPTPTPVEDPPFELGAPRRFPPGEWILGSSARRSYLMLTGSARSEQVSRVLDELDGSGVPAGLFLPGRWAKRNPAMIEAAAASGHVTGNAGWDGRRLTGRKGAAVERRIGRAENVFEALEIDPRPFLFPPGGMRDERVATRAGRLGYRLVRATIDHGDGSRKEVIRSVAQELRPGAIVRLDLGSKAHRKALPGVVRALRDADLPPAPFDEVAGADPVRWDLVFAPGSAGPRVKRMQKALRAATFPMSSFDGVYGEETLQAVLGYEKLMDLERDGIIDPEQMEAILLSRPPSPPREGLSDYLDIDIARQILFEVHDGVVFNTFAISSGNGATYDSLGRTAVANTPRGDFVVERKIPEWRTSHLGELYYPMYFTGGYAVHGSPSVPAYPASHGCVRVPISEAQGLYDRNPVGTPVFVHD